MDRLEHAPGDVEPGMRMAVLANAVADAKALMEQGRNETNDGGPARNWPPAGRLIRRHLRVHPRPL